MNTPLQIVFLVIMSAAWALMEIQIEGNGGWAENLPTWKVKNPFPKILSWPTLVDGYHLWMWATTILIFQSPFFFGWAFNIQNELVAIEMWFLFGLIEDFLWFVFNPAWGIKKFFIKEIPWHKNKILFLPQNYWVMFVIIFLFEVFRRHLS